MNHLQGDGGSYVSRALKGRWAAESQCRDKAPEVPEDRQRGRQLLADGVKESEGVAKAL